MRKITLLMKSLLVEYFMNYAARTIPKEASTEMNEALWLRVAGIK